MHYRNLLGASLLCFLCLNSQAAEPIKGATKLMLDAKASFTASQLAPAPLAVVIPPDTNKYPLYVSWDKSSDPQVAGYRVYYGTNSGVYSQQNDAGNINSNVINVVIDGVTNYVAATVYDTIGLESVYSVEARYPPESEPPKTNYVKVSLDYFSASSGQWVTNYSSRTYTNPVGNQFFRYRNGPTNRAWQSRTNQTWYDIPGTTVQDTNSGPIRFQISRWSE